MTVAELEPLCQLAVREFFPPRGCDRDDLLQEARIGAWKACRDFRDDAGASFYTFAKLCIRRQLVSYLIAGRRRKHQVLNESVALEKPQGEDDSGTLGDVVLASDAGDPLRRLLDRERLMEALAALALDLTEFEQRCFVAVAVDGVPYSEVAAALETDEKAIDNAVQRARRKLDVAMAPATCEVCGDPLGWGRRCESCEDEIEWARQFVAA